MRGQQPGGRRYSPVFRCLQRAGYGRHARRVRPRWRRTGRKRGLGERCRRPVYRDGERDFGKRGPGPGGARRRRDHRSAGRRAGRRGHGTCQPAVHDRQATLLERGKRQRHMGHGLSLAGGRPDRPVASMVRRKRRGFRWSAGDRYHCQPRAGCFADFPLGRLCDRGQHDNAQSLTPGPSPEYGRGEPVVTPGPSPEYGRGERVVTPGPAPRKASRHPRPLSRKVRQE